MTRTNLFFCGSTLVFAGLACNLGQSSQTPTVAPAQITQPPTSTPLPPTPPPTATTAPESPPATATLAATEPVACTAGNKGESPLYSHMVMRTTSADGIIFDPAAELVLEHASVPDGVIGPDGAQWVYFVNGEPGQHGPFAAREASPGVWEVIDCVKLDGEFVGDAVDPDIVRLSDGRFRLFYFLGHFVSPPPPGAMLHPMYSAISDDGINFTVEQIVLEVEQATDPTAVELPDGSWLLAVAQAQDGRTLLAASDDGYNFELTGDVFEGGGIPELGLLADGRVVLYTSGVFVSADGGATWDQVPGARVPGNGADPSIVALADGTYMFYFKTFEGGQPGPQPVGTPVRQPGQPLLPPLTPTEDG